MPDNTVVPPLPAGVVLKKSSDSSIPPLPPGVRLKKTEVAQPATPQPTPEQQEMLKRVLAAPYNLNDRVDPNANDYKKINITLTPTKRDAQGFIVDEKGSRTDASGVGYGTNKPVKGVRYIPDTEGTLKAVDYKGDKIDMSKIPVNMPAPIQFNGEEIKSANPLIKFIYSSVIGSANGMMEGLDEMHQSKGELLKGTAGFGKYAFGLAGLTAPEVAKFNLVLNGVNKVLPEKITQFESPFTTAAKIAGYNEKDDPNVLAATNLLDTFTQFAVAHGLSIALKNVRLGKGTPEEIGQVGNAIKSFGQYEGAINKMPEDLPPAQKLQAAPIVDENSNLRSTNEALAKQKETVATEFHPGIDEQIKNNKAVIEDNTKKVGDIVSPKEKPLPDGFREVAENEVLPAGDYKTIMNFEGKGINITDAPPKETPPTNEEAAEKEQPKSSSQQSKDELSKVKTNIPLSDFTVYSEIITKGGKENTFEFTKRNKDDLGGVSGVPATNQFKLNQGFTPSGEQLPRVHVILDDEDAMRYKEKNDDGKYKNTEFHNSINEIAKKHRDPNHEVVLDFRKSEVENKKSFDKPKQVPAEDKAENPHEFTPQEIDEAYAARDEDLKKLPQVEFKQQFIHDNLGRIKRSDYEEVADKNNLEGNHRGTNLRYFSNEALPIDIKAKQLSDQSGVEITPQDIVDYIDDREANPYKYKASPIDDLNNDAEIKPDVADIIAKANEFGSDPTSIESVEKLRGFPLSDQEADTLIDYLKNNKNEDANNEPTQSGEQGKGTDEKGEGMEREENPKSSQSDTSTKNAVVNAERLKEGKPPVSKIKPIDLDAIKEKVSQHLKDPETYRSADKDINPHILAQWSKDHPHEPISAWQEAILGGERDKLQNERELAHSNAEKAKNEGDMAKYVANRELALEKQHLIDTNDAANSYRGTEWSNIGRQRQQMIKNDYSPNVLLKKYQVANNFEEIPKGVEDRLRQSSSKIDELQKQVENLQGSIEVKNNEVKQQKIKDASKRISDLIRSGKLSRPGIFTAATPASIAWDGALEVVAKSVDAGGTIAQAVADGLNHIKNSDWYKGQNKVVQENAEKAYTDFFNNDNRVKRAESYYQTRLSKLQEQNEKGDYTKPIKEPPPSNPKIERLKNQIIDEKNKADRVIKERYLKDRPFYKKLFDFMSDYQHLGVITSPKAIAKVATGVIVQPIRNTIHNIGDAILSLSPALRETPDAKSAISANAKAIADRWTTLTSADTWKDSWNAFLGKTTDIDRLKGEDAEDQSPYWKKQFDVIRKILYSSGVGIHKALKNPVMKAEYNSTLRKMNETSLANGEDITDPKVIEKNKEISLAKALSVAFMQDNPVVKKWQIALSSAGEKNSSFAVDAGKFLAKTLNPVVKLPSNYARDIFELETGLVQALGQSLNQILPERFAGKGEGGGWDRMTNEQKSLLKKRILKGSAGVALSYWGWNNYQNFGGYHKDKNDPDALPLGSIKIGDKVFGESVVAKLLLHNPLWVIPQITATARRIYEEKHKKGTDVSNKAIGGAVAGGLSELPFLENTKQTLDAVTNNPKKAVAQYGGSFIPTFMRQAYQWAHPEESETAKEMEKRKQPKEPISQEDKQEKKDIKERKEGALEKEATKEGIEYVPPQKAGSGRPKRYTIKRSR